MAKFMMMMFESPTEFADLTPQQMQDLVGEYLAWAKRLTAAGKLAGGEKLADEGGRMIRGKGPGALVTDGPYAETKEVLGGYFILRADSYEEAVDLARSGPHAARGLPTLVRRIEETE